MGEELVFTYDITYTFIVRFVLVLLIWFFGFVLGYKKGIRRLGKELDKFHLWVRDNFHLRKKEGFVCWESWRDRKMPDSSGNGKDVSKMGESTNSKFEN